MDVLMVVSLLVCAVAVSAAVAIRNRVARRITLPATADWIDELSMERYRPMLRLLDDREELGFLRQQPGFTPELAARLRRQRCQIFRGYLRAIADDFSRITTAIKFLMVQAGGDRPDLAATLIRGQVSFSGAMAAAHLQLALYATGIGRVNVSGLLSAFEGMRLQLRTLVPAAPLESASAL